MIRSAMAGEVAVDIGDQDSPPSLMEQLRIHYKYKGKRTDKRHKRNVKNAVRWLVAFQAPSQLYMLHAYLIAYLLEDYDEWTHYYLKVLVTYGAIQIVANYLCTILYDTRLVKTRDRPDLPGVSDRWDNPPDQFVSLHTDNQNGSAVPIQPDDADDSGFEWKYCERCEMHQPPRTHHCDICEACILKRDHHCFVVGTCVGFKNQRYFVVLTFYAVIYGIFGGFLQFKYLQQMYYPVSYAWTDFIPPVAFYRWLFGRVDAMSLHVCIMIFHVYLEFLYGIIGFIYFTSQMMMIPRGKTLHELKKFIPIRNLNSINRNFRSVFGDFWVLNFFFPMQVIFPQTDDGKTWEGVKLDHNANLQPKTN
ncbi:palmitoyltransferase ZDHHC22-like [Mizuhopecten yessoensis]|uniref:palmitoyltransferase ZDHHC22-like n=1 Tax=Mizuhopecten yessoensis TaxID=6573 RepID=UPI000B4579BE|nr:palmitoyltransferase ZDHHC22-like [Mizuhopecten yessoensis]